MATKVFYILFSVFSLTVANAQISNDPNKSINKSLPIEVNGNKFYNNEVRLADYQVVEILESNQEAFNLSKKAKKIRTWGQISMGAGLFLIGSQIGREFANQKFLWEFAGLGAGLVGLSFPLFKSSKNKTQEAVEVYNTNLKKTSANPSTFQYDYNVALNSNGIGISVQF